MRATFWVDHDREHRQRVSQEVALLRQMSAVLRTKAVRSFVERATIKSRPLKRVVSPPKRASIAA